ncbi:MAG: ABC transporter permease [Bacteroidota bacterium]
MNQLVTKRYGHILQIALEAVFANRFRSVLTALGIIFGVSAVIAMLAIGTGAKQEILEQIKQVGVNNIIIMPNSGKANENATDEKQQSSKEKETYSPGLTLNDVSAIMEVVPTIASISPEVIYETDILKDGVSSKARLSGVTPDYFNIFSLKLGSGEMFNGEQLRQGKAVCIIGTSIKSRFFPKEDPYGKYIKCGNIWLKVIGVLENHSVRKDITESMGISDYNNFIYAPIQTILLRYRDRSLITADMVGGSSSTQVFGDDVAIFSSSESAEGTSNQLDKIIVQVKESSQIPSTTAIIQRMLKRRHAGNEDYEIKVPEALLKQEQRTKDIFNIVLGAIASISLIVGGIGIMNIMLASVVERTKEIGIRMAMGATKKDIILQFLTEATIISLTGGIIGIALGIILSKLITQFTGIQTIVTLISIAISFGVSVAVGITFGYMPAKKASDQDPVTSLRYE